MAQDKRMTLSGECNPARDGEKLYLVVGGEPCDSVIVKNGKFSFALKGIQPN